MTAGAMVEAYVAGPMVGDVAAVLVAVARFHVQNHAMRSRAPVALMCVQSVLLFVMMLMRPETGLVEDGVAVRVLRLVVLPVVIYVILPFALYTGGVVERMLAVCATTLAFCTTAFAAVGLASLRAHLLGAPPLVLTTVPLAEVLSGVSVLPGSMRTARAYAIGAMVVEIGLTLLLELMVSERARRYYAHADFLRNDRFLLFSLFQFAILGVSLTMAVSVFADGRQYLFGAAGLGWFACSWTLCCFGQWSANIGHVWIGKPRNCCNGNWTSACCSMAKSQGMWSRWRDGIMISATSWPLYPRWRGVASSMRRLGIWSRWRRLAGRCMVTIARLRGGGDDDRRYDCRRRC